MLRLASLLYSAVATILARVLVIAALKAGVSNLWLLLGVAVLGFGMAVPATYALARAITRKR